MAVVHCNTGFPGIFLRFSKLLSLFQDRIPNNLFLFLFIVCQRCKKNRTVKQPKTSKKSHLKAHFCLKNAKTLVALNASQLRWVTGDLSCSFEKENILPLKADFLVQWFWFIIHRQSVIKHVLFFNLVQKYFLLPIRFKIRRPKLQSFLAEEALSFRYQIVFENERLLWPIPELFGLF